MRSQLLCWPCHYEEWHVWLPGIGRVDSVIGNHRHPKANPLLQALYIHDVQSHERPIDGNRNSDIRNFRARHADRWLRPARDAPRSCRPLDDGSWLGQEESLDAFMTAS
jgi:hypothetical protein